MTGIDWPARERALLRARKVIALAEDRGIDRPEGLTARRVLHRMLEADAWLREQPEIVAFMRRDRGRASTTGDAGELLVGLRDLIRGQEEAFAAWAQAEARAQYDVARAYRGMGLSIAAARATARADRYEEMGAWAQGRGVRRDDAFARELAGACEAFADWRRERAEWSLGRDYRPRGMWEGRWEGTGPDSVRDALAAMVAAYRRRVEAQRAVAAEVAAMRGGQTGMVGEADVRAAARRAAAKAEDRGDEALAAAIRVLYTL